MRGSSWSKGLVTRVDGIVGSVLVREHPWWRPAFGGRPVDPGFGAAWLDEDRYGALAAGAGPVLVAGDLEAVLRAQASQSLAAVSLSNVPDWLSDEAGTGLATAVRHALAPSGRLLVRRVVAPADDPFARTGLVRDPVSDALPARERTALYERVDLYRAPS
jgi:S-adenosylmethionine:diacylglycerol 3-amino-3-carboxypropyl transferase